MDFLIAGQSFLKSWILIGTLEVTEEKSPSIKGSSLLLFDNKRVKEKN